MTTESTAGPTSKGPKKAKTVPKGSHRAVKPSDSVGSGYRRLIALALSSGQVTAINVRAVHRNDRFDYAYGLNERLEHVPAEGDRGDITHFYAYARFKDGGHCFDVLSRAEVDAVRDRSSSPWGTRYAEMGKEVAIRRIAQYLPLAKAVLDELDEIVASLPEPVPNPMTDASVLEPEPQAVDLTEEELAGLFPPGHLMRILDAASERDMPDEVLAEIAGSPLDEISPEDESAILRAIASWQH